MDIILGAAGLVALVFGGDRLVGGAVALASRAGVSPLVIGLTIVGFGTSAPELVTSVQAALQGASGLAVGNVVGSNIANILLILGLAATVAPIGAPRDAVVRDGVVMAGATLLGAALLASGGLGRAGGMLLVAGLGTYLLLALRRPAPGVAAVPVPDEAKPGLGGALLAFGIGLVLTVVGASLFVRGAVSLAAGLGVPEGIIGLTVVALGTSLPELATSLTAARRGHGDVALGNVIGSNIFNLLGILGVTALVRPISDLGAGLWVDLGVMIGATGLLLVMATTGRRISRLEGGVLAALYVLYMLWLGRQVM